MRKIAIGILVICLYGFPFVYFSMYQDFTNRSMLGYFIMVVVTSLLAFFSQLIHNLVSIIIGNFISGIISFYFISEMSGNEQWSGYFKPLTPYQLLILVSILNLIPQLLAIRLAKRNKNNEND